MDFNAPNTEHEAVYIEFIGKTISTLLLDHSDSHWKTAWPLDCKFSNDEKQKVLTWICTLLKQVKIYTDNKLNLFKVNAIDLTKDNFSQPLTVKRILDELEIWRFFQSLVHIKKEVLELHLKRQLNSWFANNYFDIGF